MIKCFVCGIRIKEGTELGVSLHRKSHVVIYYFCSSRCSSEGSNLPELNYKRMIMN